MWIKVRFEKVGFATNGIEIPKGTICQVNPMEVVGGDAYGKYIRIYAPHKVYLAYLIEFGDWCKDETVVLAAKMSEPIYSETKLDLLSNPIDNCLIHEFDPIG